MLRWVASDGACHCRCARRCGTRSGSDTPSRRERTRAGAPWRCAASSTTSGVSRCRSPSTTRRGPDTRGQTCGSCSDRPTRCSPSCWPRSTSQRCSGSTATGWPTCPPSRHRSARSCPRLAAIAAWPPGRQSAVLVDDARLFAAPPPPPHRAANWPTLVQVLDRLRADGGRYVTILDDVIIAVPAEARSVVERTWWDHRGSFEEPPEPEPPDPTPESAPSPATVPTGPRRVAAWARAAWRDLPPRETLRRAQRHLLPPHH